MMVYHLNIASKYVQSEKWIFDCRCKAEKFINNYKKNLKFIDEDTEKAWEAYRPTPTHPLTKEEMLDLFFTLTCINTEKCKNWQKLFKGKLYQCTK